MIGPWVRSKPLEQFCLLQTQLSLPSPSSLQYEDLQECTYCDLCASFRESSNQSDLIFQIFLQVVDLAQEVVAHIRQVAGSDALLEAFNNARASVKAARSERKRQQAVQVTSSCAAICVQISYALYIQCVCRESWIYNLGQRCMKRPRAFYFDFKEIRVDFYKYWSRLQKRQRLESLHIGISYLICSGLSITAKV